MNRQIKRLTGLLAAAFILAGGAVPAAADGIPAAESAASGYAEGRSEVPESAASGFAEDTEALELRTYMLQDYDSEAHVTYGSGHYQEIRLNGPAAERHAALQNALEAFDREYAAAQTASLFPAYVLILHRRNKRKRQ